MLIFLHKIVFIENETGVLCGNVQGDLQVQSKLKVFDIAFAIKIFNFCDALSKCTLVWEQGISKN